MSGDAGSTMFCGVTASHQPRAIFSHLVPLNQTELPRPRALTFKVDILQEGVRLGKEDSMSGQQRVEAAQRVL